jgi:hypothetical protein
MVGLGLGLSGIDLRCPLLAVVMKLLLLGCLVLVVGDPNILVGFPLSGKVMKQSLPPFFICSIAHGDCLDVSPQGHMGGSNLHELNSSEVEVCSCGVSSMLLCLGNGVVEV